MYDVIVIGSGIGGLTAAGLLAGVAGKKVLVLEKHTEPGGQTHTFRRDGASWDVGLHYVGDMDKGSLSRALFDYLSGGQLHWNRMPDDFERFIYPGLDFAVPSDPKAYQQRLVARFPEEAKAIRRYFRDVAAAARWVVLGFMRQMVPGPVAPLVGVVQRLTGRKATQTTKAYLERQFRSPLLRALLASQWGDYGLPPAHSAFAVHALIVSHYLHGAWFPVGGSARIARSFEASIEAAGGAVRVAQEVLEIVVENGRAVGVKAIDRRAAQSHAVLYQAPVIISDVGAALTYKQLLPTRDAIGSKTAAVRALIDRLSQGYSAVTLYLRLKASAATLGVQGENYWINADLEHDAVAEHNKELLGGHPRRIYVSFPSLKSGDARFHTAEIIALADASAFAKWRKQPKGNRGADYSALKQRIGAGMLQLAETAIPGLTALVAYAELSTPLTMEHYTSHPGGRFYGLAATPERFRTALLGPRTPIPGLFLSGCDAGTMGIVGAMMGGVSAVCQILGPKAFPMIQMAIKKKPTAPTSAPLPEGKQHATLVAKQHLTDLVWLLHYELAAEVGNFAPGQFARLHTGEGQWRDYSIAGLQGQRLALLVSTRTGGHGSHFVSSVATGTSTEIELPLGQYSLRTNARHKVFVATGTGIAPFLPMLAQLQREGHGAKTTLLFGCRGPEDDLTQHLDLACGTLIRCYSRTAAAEGGFAGRVSAALESLAFVPDATDFYLCGSAAMVADCQAILERRGAQAIFTEAY